MRPESGRMSPITSFKIRLFPDPATPKRALVSPLVRRKETPRKTSLSPKPTATSSKTTAGEEFSFVFTATESSGEVGADIRSAVGKNRHQQPCDEKIEHENQYGRGDHGLGCGAAHALGPSACIHSVKAADGRDDKTKQDRLHQSHKHVLEYQSLPRVRPILPPVQM